MNIYQTPASENVSDTLPKGIHIQVSTVER